MIDQWVLMWLVLVGVIEAGAFFAASVYMLSAEGLKETKLFKAGLIMLMMGLIVQLSRSAHYATTGTYPVDNYFPLWILKDIGASILIFEKVKNK
jgi:hypothetical protein